MRSVFLFLFGMLLLATLVAIPQTASAVESVNGVVLEGNGIATGTVQLKGVAQHPTFRKWQLDLLLDGAEVVFLTLGEQPQTEMGMLAELDTTRYPDGEHLLRLRVVHSNLNYDEYYTPITFANHSPNPAVSIPATPPDPVIDEPAPMPANEQSPGSPDTNGFQLTDKTLRGTVALQGVANHPTFRKWQVDLLVDRDPTQAHFIALGEDAVPSSAELAALDTTQFPDGEHLLRLRVVHSNLNYDEYYTPVTVANRSPQVQEPEPAEAPAPVIQGFDLSNAPADGKRWIEVDLSAQTLTAWQGDVAVLHTLVSTGRPATPTVRGRYSIRTKIPAQRMTGPGYDLPNVPSVMYFYAGYAIHGAYWHNNFGQTMSHGCVNMKLDEAAALYEWASIGTEVYVHD